jgi:hypothetical protein
MTDTAAYGWDTAPMLDAVLKDGESISWSTLVERCVAYMADGRPLNQVTMSGTVSAAVAYITGWRDHYGAVRTDDKGLTWHRTNENYGSKAKPRFHGDIGPSTGTRLALIDENGKEVFPRIGPEADAEVKRIQAVMKQRRINQHRAESGLPPQELGLDIPAETQGSSSGTPTTPMEK